jgi:predicted negative regulator of RcsB-dependent stress response
LKLGHLDEAERYLSESVTRDGTSALSQEHLGDVHASRGNTQLARAAWNRALSLSVEAESKVRLERKLNSTIKE